MVQNYVLLRSVGEENVRADGDLNKRRTYDLRVPNKESSAKLPFVEVGRRGNIRAADDLNKRRIYDLSELFCVPQVRYNGSSILFPPHIQTLLSPRYSPKPPMIKRFHKGDYENLRRHLHQHLSHLL